jgi:hypothetical protein
VSPTLAVRWAVVAALVSVLITSQGALAAPHAFSATSVWSVVPSPDTGGGDDPVAVAATSATDAWLVGDRFNVSSNHYLTLIEHWNGTAWSVVSSPSPRSFNWLYGVAAVSSTDAWAVGFSNNSWWGNNKTLVEHWNGTNWSIVPSPSPNTENELFGVAALASNDVWAVGGTGSGGTKKTLVEHWNGSSWSVVPSPNADSYDDLFGVTADPQGGLWAVGTGIPDSGPQQWETVAEHFDGTHWNLMTTVNPNTSNFLDRPAAISSTDVWAVGHQYDTNYIAQTLIEHWNGTAWSVVAAPPTGSELRTAAAVSSSDVWAIGTTGAGKTLTERWNGTAWSVVASPNVGTGFNSLEGVFALSTGELWAVGTYDGGSSGSRALILHARRG